jgi:hypothetical protein
MHLYICSVSYQQIMTYKYTYLRGLDCWDKEYSNEPATTYEYIYHTYLVEHSKGLL